MKHILKISLLTFTVLLGACTDLEEQPFSEIFADEFYKTEAEFEAAQATVYSTMSILSDWRLEGLDMESDAIAIPQRGNAWGYDGFKQFERHRILSTEQRMMGSFWAGLYKGIMTANATLETFSLAEQSDLNALYSAETRLLRALFYMYLIDMWGDVPLVTASRVETTNLAGRESRSVVFDFIESELLEVAQVIPSRGESDALPFPRVTKETAHALLATLYLNAEIWKGQAMLDECVEQCDKILKNGNYGLVDNYFDLFKVKNEDASREILLYLDIEAGITNGNLPTVNRSLTDTYIKDLYPSFPSKGQNGMCVQPYFYNMMDDDDIRKSEGLLAGLVIGKNGEPLKESGQEINHKVEFDYWDAGLFDGVRITKWEVDMGAIGIFNSHGVPLIRLADIMLQKAEALIRKSGPNAVSDDLINQVRARVFDPALHSEKLRSGYTLEAVYWERGFELLSEGHRRRDMVRFGTFTEASKDLKGDGSPWYEAHSADYILWPIPQGDMDANPNLKQNEGY
ncbi:RagB/SusD family nutrient uptake outer membrane protein [Limibacter armeniacum]|uniref:RagB/SusD family nutrient uptake outer membrane protein n=1 Tax=Limibacter armeniacum TaxID=466084 RepID=UPI002FE5DE34